MIKNEKAIVTIIKPKSATINLFIFTFCTSSFSSLRARYAIIMIIPDNAATKRCNKEGVDYIGIEINKEYCDSQTN